MRSNDMARHLRRAAYILAAAASASVFAQAPAAVGAAPAAAAQSASGPSGVIGSTLPRVPSQRQTVEDMLRMDAEQALNARLAKERQAAEAAAAAASAAAKKANPAPEQEIKPLAGRGGFVEEVQASITVDSIYGTTSSEKDSRVADVIIDGRAKAMRPGDLYAGYRLIGIRGMCVIMLKEVAVAAPASPAAKAVKLAKGAVQTAPAPKAKPREICITDAPPASENLLTVPGGRPGLPSPVYTPPNLQPGQPVFATPGTVSGAPLPPVPLAPNTIGR